MSESTPEEKLLRLIRQGQKGAEPPSGPARAPGPPAVPPAPAAAQAVPKSFPSPGRSGRSGPVLRVSLPVAFPEELRGLRTLIQVVLIAAVGVLGYLVSTVMAPKPPPVVGQGSEPATPIEVEPPPEPSAPPEVTRPLFQAPQAPSAPGGPGAAAPVSATELAKDWSLLGIVPDEPTQAIIGDAKTNRTYFLKVGDTVGEFQLEAILLDKVILIRDGQRVELVM